MHQSALIVIDIQNDYFPAGKYPQYQALSVLGKVLDAMDIAIQRQWPVILVQHVAAPEAPFMRQGSEGAELHPLIKAKGGEKYVIEKRHADGFFNTELLHLLTRLGISDVVLCGMMTQNCITHTALSPSARDLNVRVLPDACAGPDAMVHAVALRALANRVTLLAIDDL